MSHFIFPSQAFFTTTFGLSSGAVVTFMSLDRVVSLYKPFFYRQHATPCLTRTLCIILTLFCMTLAALPFAGIGKYKYNQSSRSFCNFDWFPTTLADTVYIFAIATCGVLLISLMTLSNIVVFIIVVRIRMRMAAVLPSEINVRRRARRVTFCQEERMAKFVALVSIVFLITWSPVTVSSCAICCLGNQSHTFSSLEPPFILVTWSAKRSNDISKRELRVVQWGARGGGGGGTLYRSDLESPLVVFMKKIMCL